jgi:hypothetical protein
MKRPAIRWTAMVAATAAFVVPAAARAQAPPPATPREMVAAYEALADTILGANKTEVKLVQAILAASYGHAQGEVARARQALKANDAAAARSAVENVAAAVGQIGRKATTRSRACASACSRAGTTPTRKARGRDLRRRLRRGDQGGQAGVPRFVEGAGHVGP